MRKRETLRERAIKAVHRMWPYLGSASEPDITTWLAGHRANRISAAERRVVEAAVRAVKSGVGLGQAHADLAREVAKLERAKGGANG